MNRTKKVAYYTLGCKLNFSETATISRGLVDEGFERVEFSEKADMYVINTCSVTDNADKRFKNIVKQAYTKNPDAFIVAIGCYAQLKPEELAAVHGVDLVLGASEKFKINDYINDLNKNEIGEVHACEIEEANFYVGSYSIGERTRAFLKVQDGCDYKCTFCTIPLARGVSRSDTLSNVIKNAREIANKGIKEIVLTGVNIGDYGKGEFGNKNHEHTFLELIQELDRIEGIERIRISSIEPNLLKDEIIELVSRSRAFVSHFHLPLQSGSNSILKLMKRRYQKELYTDRVELIRKLMPQACIGVDVIVGFPGETDEHFQETYQILNELEISYLHVFTYSERDNTEAILMEDSVPMNVRKKRSKMLRGLSVKKRRAFYEGQLGSRRDVLFEGENKDGFIHGFTDNYVKVRAPWNPDLVNTIHRVELTGIDDEGYVLFDFVYEELLG
jgi:threonylcarbamoyladenosine tRNA methylthiotransferase MtaB